MAEPTLLEVFGPSATQDATTITISKADLNLTPSANNRAESIVAALVEKWAENLTETLRSNDPDNRQVTVIKTGNQIYDDGTNNEKLITTFANQFFSDYSSPSFNPDDY